MTNKLAVISTDEVEHLIKAHTYDYTYESWRTKESVTETATLETWNELHEWLWGNQDELLLIPGLGVLKFVTAYGGEGQGDEYWFVFKIEDEGTVRHFKVSGWYQSYAGGEYDSMDEVTPKDRVVTFYE